MRISVTIASDGYIEKSYFPYLMLVVHLIVYDKMEFVFTQMLLHTSLYNTSQGWGEQFVPSCVCCGWTIIVFTHILQGFFTGDWGSSYWPSIGEETQKNMGKSGTWIHY